MSSEPENPESPENPETPEGERRSPYSSTLAHLGKSMRVYGNTLLVLMIVMFFIAIFIFMIVFEPVIAGLVIIFGIKAFEIGFYSQFISALKKSENTYGGHYLNKAFFLLLSMLLLTILILIVGAIFVGMNSDDLLPIYSENGPAEKVFFYYTMLSSSATWLRYIELLLPILSIAGSLLLYKWGNLYVGDRLEEEFDAPFPREMKMMIVGNTVMLMGMITGIIVSYLPDTIFSPYNVLPVLKFITSLLQIIGSIIIAVGFSRAGYNLELYTTKDKKKFFSSKIYED